MLFLSGINIFSVALADASLKISSPSSTLDPDVAELRWNYTTKGGVRDVAISADGGLVAASTYDNDGFVYLFNDTVSNSKVPLWKYNLTTSGYGIDITADGNYIAAISDDANVLYFNDSVASPKMPEWEFYPASTYLNDVAISANGNYIVAADDDGVVYLFNSTYSNPKTEMWNFTAGGSVWSVSISADGNYIAVASWDEYLYVFEKTSSTPLWNFTEGYAVNSVEISADGNFLVAGTDNNNTLLFSTSSNIPIWSHNTSGYIFSVAINSNGNYIAAGGYDNTLYFFERSSSTPLWNYTTGDHIGNNQFDEANPHCIDISANGDYIAVGSNDNHTYAFEKSSAIPLWNYTTGGEINAVAISANGAFITVGSADQQVYLFFQDVLTTSSTSISFGYWFILFALPACVAIIVIRRKSYKKI